LRNKTNEVTESKNKWNCHPPKTITTIDKSTTIITRVKLCYCICYEIYLPTSYFPWLVHKNPSCIETNLYTILYHSFRYWSIQDHRPALTLPLLPVDMIVTKIAFVLCFKIMIKTTQGIGEPLPPSQVWSQVPEMIDITSITVSNLLKKQTGKKTATS
jgi:hypothetical protein